MKTSHKNHPNKYVLALGLCFIWSMSHAAVYDIQSQDLLTPLDDEIKFDAPFDDAKSLQEAPAEPPQTKVKENYQNVLELIKQKKIDQAEAKVNELLSQFPKEAEFYNLKALVEIQQKKLEAANQSYQEALKLNPKSLTALKGLTILAIEKNDFISAQDFANKAIAVDSKAVIAYKLKANIAYRQKNLIEVENILSTALQNVKGDINLELQAARDLIRLYSMNQTPGKILDLAQDIQQRHPDEKRALSLLARAQILNKQPERAEQTLQKIISTDGQDVMHRLFLAQLLMNKPNGSKEAIKLIDEALQVNPNDLNALTFKTVFLTHEKDFQSALEHADKIEKLAPDSAIGKVLKADALLGEQKYDKGLDYYQQAYRIKADQKLLPQIIGLLNKQGKTNEAIDFLNKEIDKNPKNLEGHFQLANLYYGQQEYSKAQSHYETVLNETPKNPIILNNLAMVYLYQNDNKALDMANKAYELLPNSAAIADTYGQVLLKHGKSKEALNKFKQAAEMAPQSNDIQFHLAQAYQANGNKKAAVEILEKISHSSTAFSKQKAANDLLKQLQAN